MSRTSMTTSGGRGVRRRREYVGRMAQPIAAVTAWPRAAPQAVAQPATVADVTRHWGRFPSRHVYVDFDTPACPVSHAETSAFGWTTATARAAHSAATAG